MKGAGAPMRRSHWRASAAFDRVCFQNCEDIVGKTIFDRNLSNLFYRTCQDISSAMLPRRCVICGAGINETVAHPLGRFACRNCLNTLSCASGVRCQRCGLTLGPRLQEFGWTHCRHCRPIVAEQDPAARTCVVCCDYAPPFDQWIAQLKYGKAHGLAEFLGQWLGMNAFQAMPDLPDLLVPVPCSREKLKLRGYNQAALIARYAGRVLKRPVDTRLLLKAGEAETQAELGRTERLKNLRGAFLASRPVLADLTVGLVDDVITTGTTMESCEDALRKAGAKTIVILAVCRTPE
jgi:ComF family protein